MMPAVPLGPFLGLRTLTCSGRSGLRLWPPAGAHVASFGATLNGKLVGSNFVTNWGSVGFFGPSTVRPDLQERDIAQALLAKTSEQFDIWRTRHVRAFTFSRSAKHIALRFLPAFLTAASR
jgi:hypothetical protein